MAIKLKKKEKSPVEWWTEKAKLLEGLTIVKVRYLTKGEIKQLGWYNSAVVLQLSTGIEIYPSADDEGNGAGALFIEGFDKRMPKTLPVIPL